MNDSDFDDLLRSARGDRPLPTSFRQQVWRRIENDAAALPLRWYHRVFAAVTKPWGAAAGFAATVAIGLALGLITTPKEDSSASSYAYSISPFAQTHH
ncbi:hypothetical protein [Haloferula sp. BvORR071]|uniref:hypothetical protein n=1 Tax=Haloferula sp. BvORR071 TaxID=1396141 RepID=UPI000557FD25|nr:hypothetical protein [Haloferula sp. BvORR071]